MTAETTLAPPTVSDTPVGEEALAAEPRGRAYYQNRADTLALEDRLVHATDPLGAVVDEARQEQQKHLVYLTRPHTLASTRSLERAEGAELAFAAGDPPALLALPEPSEHGWMDRMAAEIAAPDVDADAAVARFTAVHDELPPEADPLADDEEAAEPMGESELDGQPTEPEPDAGTAGWFPFDSEGPESA